MNLVGVIDAELYAWVILPFLIFFARICDVSLGTIRIIFVSKGIKYLAPMVGFVEIIIWLLAISQIMQNITNVYYYIFYAGGFAMGNFFGILIDERLSIGTVAVRIITRKDASELTETLKKKGYGITIVDAEGKKGKVKLIFTIVNRKNINNVIATVKKYNPKSFYSIEDIRFVSEYLPSYNRRWIDNSKTMFTKAFAKKK
jgi:uncharacterized protein YebE (UPF0316 family)